MTSNFELKCSNLHLQRNPHPNDIQLCIGWANYVARFNNNGYAPQPEHVAMPTTPVGSYTDALATAEEWRDYEGYQDIQNGNYDTVLTVRWCGQSFENDQHCRYLRGDGPVEMPASLREISSKGIDMTTTPFGIDPVARLRMGGDRVMHNTGHKPINEYPEIRSNTPIDNSGFWFVCIIISGILWVRFK